MPYSAEISRTNPSCFLFLIDQSGSMKKPFGLEAEKTKAEGVAEAINGLLQNLVLKCAKSEGTRDYFHVGVIGYGSETGPAFAGALTGKQLVRISEIANNPVRLEERSTASGEKVKFPIWFLPKAKGKTPMCRALALAAESAESFVKQFPACYPPLVINITDGAATDGSPEPFAIRLRDLSSQDGNVLLFNARLSSWQAIPIEFPDNAESLPDEYDRILFRMSSLLPSRIRAAARNEGIWTSEASVGFVCNADLASVIRFIDIGTTIAGPVAVAGDHRVESVSKQTK